VAARADSLGRGFVERGRRGADRHGQLVVDDEALVLAGGVGVRLKCKPVVGLRAVVGELAGDLARDRAGNVGVDGDEGRSDGGAPFVGWARNDGQGHGGGD